MSEKQSAPPITNPPDYPPVCVILYPDRVVCKPIQTAPMLTWVGIGLLVLSVLILAYRRIGRAKQG